MKRVLGTGRILALVSLVFAAIPGSVMAGPINVDGARDGNDAYTNSFIANWTNEHHKDGSIYQDGMQETTVWWEEDSDFFYLYTEVPIWAKNMIWGAGVSAAELALYDVHNMSLGHHSTLSGIDYGKAAGSEKALFGGITANLNATTSGRLLVKKAVN